MFPILPLILRFLPRIRSEPLDIYPVQSDVQRRSWRCGNHHRLKRQHHCFYRRVRVGICHFTYQ